MTKVFSFIKKEAVLCVSFLLSVGSMFFVTPSADYIGYIDFRTLALLLCLMIVMAGFGALGVFDSIAHSLLKKATGSRSLYLVLVLLCFFSSMVITNDVALITFVPFTIITLKLAGQEKRMMYTVAMQTVAANLGSMLTPLGNPQNLYLFSVFNLSGSDFVRTIYPYCLLSLVLLLAGIFFAGNEKLNTSLRQNGESFDKKKIVVYSLLFVVSLLTAFRILHYGILLGIVLCAVLIFDRRILLKVDYSLLFTFVFLFVFIGNLGEIETISTFLKGIVAGNEVPVAVAVSQVFSNVPACLLLSGFTENATALLVGVNLGGLGTLIASMASLISFKYIAKEKVKSGKYILLFTVVNLLFLALNLLLWLVIEKKI